MDAHGYVFTYPGSFYAFTGMEWVWGICIGVGHLYCILTVRLLGRRQWER